MTLTVCVTEAFLTALSDIEAFLTDTGYSIYYDRLIDTLQLSIIPRIQQYPAIGRNFNVRSGFSIEELLYAIDERDTISLMNEIKDIREYLFNPCILLYGVSPTRIDLLYLLHHRQALQF